MLWRPWRMLTIPVAVLGWVPSISAATLFQSIPDLTATPVVNGYCSPCGYGRGGGPLFDTFSLGAASTIDSISLDVSGVSQFFIEASIWTVTGGGQPGSQLFLQSFSLHDHLTISSTTSTANGDTVLVTLNPSDLVLSAGTYDISFYAGLSGFLAIPTYTGGSGLFGGGCGELWLGGINGLCYEWIHCFHNSTPSHPPAPRRRSRRDRSARLAQETEGIQDRERFHLGD
jgi:hypothetical protein